MTVFDNFKSRSIDELVEWLDEYCMLGESPWDNWFNETYCKKCFAEIANGHEYGWCELHNKCKFFQSLNDIPDSKQIIKMWLECEV